MGLRRAGTRRQPSGVEPVDVSGARRPCKRPAIGWNRAATDPTAGWPCNSGLFSTIADRAQTPNGPDDWFIISGRARQGDSGGGVFIGRKIGRRALGHGRTRGGLRSSGPASLIAGFGDRRRGRDAKEIGPRTCPHAGQTRRKRRGESGEWRAKSRVAVGQRHRKPRRRPRRPDRGAIKWEEAQVHAAPPAGRPPHRLLLNRRRSRLQKSIRHPRLPPELSFSVRWPSAAAFYTFTKRRFGQ